MAAKKTSVDAAAGFFDDTTPAREVVHDVQGVQPKAKKGQERSIEHKTGRKITHVHAILYADDLDALKEIAWTKKISTNELIRQVLTDYVRAHGGEA